MKTILLQGIGGYWEENMRIALDGPNIVLKYYYCNPAGRAMVQIWGLSISMYRLTLSWRNIQWLTHLENYFFTYFLSFKKGFLVNVMLIIVYLSLKLVKLVNIINNTPTNFNFVQTQKYLKRHYCQVEPHFVDKPLDSKTAA